MSMIFSRNLYSAPKIAARFFSEEKLASVGTVEVSKCQRFKRFTVTLFFYERIPMKLEFIRAETGWYVVFKGTYEGPFRTKMLAKEYGEAEAGMPYKIVFVSPWIAPI
jgi:hypothetical protein